MGWSSMAWHLLGSLMPAQKGCMCCFLPGAQDDAWCCVMEERPCLQLSTCLIPVQAVVFFPHNSLTVSTARVAWRGS